jgi:biopolymer transport protein ExbD
MMSWLNRRKKIQQEAEDLDVTPIMNLMIVLVPILSLTMIFTHIRVLQVQLPELITQMQSLADPQKQSLELLISNDRLAVYYPSGQLLKAFAHNSHTQDRAYAELNAYLQQIKSTFVQRKIDKRDIVLKPTADVSYQTLVSVMDHVSQYRTLVATSVVQVELFPQISFADAPNQFSVSSKPFSDKQ